jgi:RNA-splicing ligase RtcB
MHGGTNDGAPNPGRNRETHGLTGDRQRWFDRHRDDVEPVVRELLRSYVEDAPFGWDSRAKVDQLAAVVIDQVRLRQSNQHLDQFVVEEVVDVTDDGTEITRVKENPAHQPRDRVKRTNIRVLKELGVLDDSGEQSTGQTITEFFSQ